MDIQPGRDLGGGSVGEPAAQLGPDLGGRRGLGATARLAFDPRTSLTAADWPVALIIGLAYAVVFVIGVVLRIQFLLLVGGFAALWWLARACVLLARNRERRGRDGA